MNTQEFLSQALEIDKKITAEREQLVALRASAERCTSNLTAVPGGHSGESRPPERLAIAIADLEAKIQADTLAQAEAEQAILAAIYRLPDANMRRVMELRYIEGLDIPEIMRRMNYSRRWVQTMHSSAIEAIECLHPLCAPSALELHP